MDECRTYYLSKYTDESIEIPITEMLPEHKKQIESYVRMMDTLSEVNQLYLVFLENVHAFSDNYILEPDDRVISINNQQNAGFITVNMLFSNIICAGRVLADSIDVFLKNDLATDEAKSYKHMADIYDTVFAYRFFYHLRNLCQHGYLAVSELPDHRFCFDLIQIRRAKHISFNEKVRSERDDIIKEIELKYGDEPHLMFTKHVDDYVRSVLEVYSDFLQHISRDIIDKDNGFRELLKNHPEYICEEEPFKGAVIYDVEDGNAEMFFPKDYSMDYYRRIRGVARKNIKNYDREFHMNS